LVAQRILFYAETRSILQQIRSFRGAHWAQLLYFARQYPIGVFRISLVEPEEVEPTVFQLQGITTVD
jgi:hypothetical protein